MEKEEDDDDDENTHTHTRADRPLPEGQSEAEVGARRGKSGARNSVASSVCQGSDTGLKTKTGANLCIINCSKQWGRYR